MTISSTWSICGATGLVRQGTAEQGIADAERRRKRREKEEAARRKSQR